MPTLPDFTQLRATLQSLQSAKTPLEACLASEVAFAQQLVSAVAASLSGLAEVVLAAGTLTPQLQVHEEHFV